jgi:hypothetical protein
MPQEIDVMHKSNWINRCLSFIGILALLVAFLSPSSAKAQTISTNEWITTKAEQSNQHTADQTNTTDIFYEDFSDNGARWTLGKEWQIGPTRTSYGHEYGNPDPAYDHTPGDNNGVAGVVIGGNASTWPSHNCYYLISPKINAAVPGTLTLEFYRWLNSDYVPRMQNKIQVYNGTTWVTLWRSGKAPGIMDSAWTKISFDLTQYKNPNLRVRFSHNVGREEPYVVSSWNIDDVRIFYTP